MVGAGARAAFSLREERFSLRPVGENFVVQIALTNQLHP